MFRELCALSDMDTEGYVSKDSDVQSQTKTPHFHIDLQGSSLSMCRVSDSAPSEPYMKMVQIFKLPQRQIVKSTLV